MLFYERADTLEPVDMMAEISASASVEAASVASGIPVADIVVPSGRIKRLPQVSCVLLLDGLRVCMKFFQITKQQEARLSDILDEGSSFGYLRCPILTTSRRKLHLQAY